MKMSVEEVDALKQEIENKDKLITIYRQKIAELEEELRIQIELAHSPGPGFSSYSQSDSKDEWAWRPEAPFRDFQSSGEKNSLAPLLKKSLQFSK